MRDAIAEITELKSMSALKPEDYALEDGLADSFVANSNIKATQLRKFFHAVKDIQREFKHEQKFDKSRVALMMPMLAYAVGRNVIPQTFYTLMELIFIKKTTTLEDFESAVNFLEAVMAYHKYHEKMKD
jgi:CRISPR-associated protein Csm2